MKAILKFTAVAAVLAVVFAVGTASAATAVRQSTCTETFGSNTMTYDCAFQVRNYSLGDTVKVNLNYECTDDCGPVLSFGLDGPGFVPKGVGCALTGGSRTSSGVSLKFACTSLKNRGNALSGNGHFQMTVGMSDGNGGFEYHPCSVRVHISGKQ